MKENSTKEKILEVSLRLFSRHGYSAVSIRDICKEVGIKESTVYYHFKNKQAILDSLRRRFQETAVALTSGLFVAMRKDKAKEGFIMEAVSSSFFEEYLMDEFCNHFLRVMAIEQHHNPELRAYFREWVFEKPLQIQGAVFEQLQSQGLFAGKDPSRLALQYYAPIFFYLQKYLLAGELNEESKECFRRAVRQHLVSLTEEWRNG